jgi:PIN domain nuclease of toxin-antitoxin system
MKLLLDSHTLIWAADDPAKLTALVQGLLQDPSHDRLISAATLWEIAIKFGLGKLPLSLPYRQWMDKAMADLVLVVLPITLDHTERHASLPWHHRDPFDRLLVAQAHVEGVPLVSVDSNLDQYGISRIW